MPQKLSMDLGLAYIPETPNPVIFEELYKVYNAIKILAATVDQYTGALQPDEVEWPTVSIFSIRIQNINKIYVPFSEDVTPGQLVTLFNDSGVLTAKKAGGPPVFAGDWAGDCRGFMSLTSTVSAGSYGEVTLGGLDPLIGGLTPGDIYYVSNATAGNITNIPTTTSGERKQPIGYALASNALYFSPTVLAELIP